MPGRARRRCTAEPSGDARQGRRRCTARPVGDTRQGQAEKHGRARRRCTAGPGGDVRQSQAEMHGRARRICTAGPGGDTRQGQTDDGPNLQATTAAGCPEARPSYGLEQCNTHDRPHWRRRPRNVLWPALGPRTSAVHQKAPIGDDGRRMSFGPPALTILLIFVNWKHKTLSAANLVVYQSACRSHS